MASGIAVNAEVKEQLLAVQSSGKFGCKVQLVNQKFVVALEFNGQDFGDWQPLKDAADQKEPAWFLIRSKRTAGKWICVFYCPGAASVMNRMVYASSTNSLKSGFNSTIFVKDYHVTVASDLDYAEYLPTLADYDPKELMTSEEVTRMEGEFASAMASGGGKKAVTVRMNMNTGEGLLEAIAAVKTGANTVVIDIDTKTETLVLKGNSNLDAKGLKALLRDDPLYVLHNFSYNHEGEDKSRLFFIYYAPTKAKARAKMIYSSTKSKALSLCAEQGIENLRNYEFSDDADCTHDFFVNDLHPVVVAAKTFSKPTTRGKGGKRLIGGVKFNAGAAAAAADASGDAAPVEDI